MYIDRLGAKHTPSKGDVVKDRKGSFAIIFDNKNRILVTAGPHAPEVPELPGGGIDDGEDAEKAVIREIYEETAQTVQDYTIKKQWNFDVGFYADDVNEYWNYQKFYFEIELKNAKHFFDGKIKTPEGGLSWWQDIKDVKSMNFRATDKEFLKQHGFI
jgi:8-oxo-dGTP pyrophosphatase MutT (NUDIX family)